jgi:hypothetical protein
MITIAHTESGSLLLTGHGAAQIVALHDAPALASAIRRIIARPLPATRPPAMPGQAAPTAARLGQRLAQMRQRYVVEV